MANAEGDAAMERYARGDATAFAELYRILWPPLYRYVRWMLSSEEGAEDVVQQTFLNMHCARGSFVSGALVLPWARSIAENLVNDLRRRRARDQRWTIAGWEVSQSQPTRPDEQAAAEQQLASLRIAYEHLLPSQRVVLQYRAQGLSLIEMAVALQTTVVAIKLRVHRATRTLRKAVDRRLHGNLSAQSAY